MIGDIEDARDIGPVDVMLVGRRGRFFPSFSAIYNRKMQTLSLFSCILPRNEGQKRAGILLAGPNVVQHDMVINAMLMLLSLDMFLQCFFQ